VAVLGCPGGVHGIRCAGVATRSTPNPRRVPDDRCSFWFGEPACAPALFPREGEAFSTAAVATVFMASLIEPAAAPRWARRLLMGGPFAVIIVVVGIDGPRWHAYWAACCP
jgi:hypothetical protein